MTTTTTPGPYIAPTPASARALLAPSIKGEMVMLNLLRFRAVADYAATPDLAPHTPISGAEAFARYVEHTLPLLRESGGDLLFLAEGGGWLIGPDEERWDAVMLVRQQSVETFLAFGSNGAIRAGLGHRTAAVDDARLLPLVESRLPD